MAAVIHFLCRSCNLLQLYCPVAKAMRLQATITAWRRRLSFSAAVKTSWSDDFAAATVYVNLPAMVATTSSFIVTVQEQHACSVCCPIVYLVAPACETSTSLTDKVGLLQPSLQELSSIPISLQATESFIRLYLGKKCQLLGNGHFFKTRPSESS